MALFHCFMLFMVSSFLLNFSYATRDFNVTIEESVSNTSNGRRDFCFRNRRICYKGKLCIKPDSSRYCRCWRRWTGPNCRQKLNKEPSCQSMTCQNGGTCTNTETSYTCTCNKGWTGKDCTTCSPGTYGFQCKDICKGHCVGGCNSATGDCDNGCEPGWMGEHCDHECTEGIACIHVYIVETVLDVVRQMEFV